MNKGSKAPFFWPTFFTLSGYIYSWSLWLSTMPHTAITHGRLFHLCDPGWCTRASIETKLLWHFQGKKLKNKAAAEWWIFLQQSLVHPSTSLRDRAAVASVSAGVPGSLLTNNTPQILLRDLKVLPEQQEIAVTASEIWAYPKSCT